MYKCRVYENMQSVLLKYLFSLLTQNVIAMVEIPCHPQICLAWAPALIIEMLLLLIYSIHVLLGIFAHGFQTYFQAKQKQLLVLCLLVSFVNVVLGLVLVDPQKLTQAPIREQAWPLLPAHLLRPVLAILLIPRYRFHCLNVLKTIGNLLPITWIAGLFILVFSTWGYVMFNEHNPYFLDLRTSLLNMFILLTTANFPDIMLPSYELNGFTSLFFVLYLLLSLMFIMNLILSQVFNFFEHASTQDNVYAKRKITKAMQTAYRLLSHSSRTRRHRKTYQKKYDCVSVYICPFYLRPKTLGTRRSSTFMCVYDMSMCILFVVVAVFLLLLRKSTM